MLCQFVYLCFLVCAAIAVGGKQILYNNSKTGLCNDACLAHLQAICPFCMSEAWSWILLTSLSTQFLLSELVVGITDLYHFTQFSVILAMAETLMAMEKHSMFASYSHAGQGKNKIYIMWSK